MVVSRAHTAVDDCIGRQPLFCTYDNLLARSRAQVGDGKWWETDANGVCRDHTSPVSASLFIVNAKVKFTACRIAASMFTKGNNLS